jgi:predicted acetyltransferase
MTFVDLPGGQGGSITVVAAALRDRTVTRLRAAEGDGIVAGMTDVDIVHPVPVEEVPAWAETLTINFLNDPTEEGHQRFTTRLQRDWLPDRFWGARAGAHWVGTLGAWPHTLTVPGGNTVPADALTMVSVAGTHRRRGLLTRMLTESLSAAHQRGDAVSILWEAEWPIYGRFGYAPATITASYTLRPRSPGGRLDGADGDLRRVDAAELGTLAPEIFARAARQRAGNIDRPQRWWSGMLGLDGYPEPRFDGKRPTQVVHEGPHGPDGYIAWTAQDVAVDVVDLCAASDSAYRGLWAYVSSLDLVERVTLGRRPVDEPVRWLLPDGRALEQNETVDGLWVRLLDVPAALGARRYSVADRLVLDVVDDDTGGFAAGRYVLEGGPDGAKCLPSTVDSANLRVHHRALAAAYLGGYRLQAQVITGRVEELTPGALRRADAMFATSLAPWCATGF